MFTQGQINRDRESKKNQREQIEKYGITMCSDLAILFDEHKDFDKSLEQTKEYVKFAYHFNQEITDAIVSFVYYKYHACFTDIFWNIDKYCELVTKILQAK